MYNKHVLTEVALVNITQSTSTTPNLQLKKVEKVEENVPPPQVQLTQAPVNNDQSRGDDGRSNRGGRGRGRGKSNVQCQLCEKIGHTFAACWQRFNPNFAPPPPSNRQKQGSRSGQFFYPNFAPQ